LDASAIRHVNYRYLLCRLTPLGVDIPSNTLRAPSPSPLASSGVKAYLKHDCVEYSSDSPINLYTLDRERRKNIKIAKHELALA
jgi:hypothetical protein